MSKKKKKKKNSPRKVEESPLIGKEVDHKIGGKGKVLAISPSEGEPKRALIYWLNSEEIPKVGIYNGFPQCSWLTCIEAGL